VIRRTAAVALLLLAVLPASSSAAGCWSARVKAADKIARSREGRVAFALIDADGKLHRRDGRATFRTASLLKPLPMATYLRRSDVRGRTNPSHRYGSETIRRITAKLVRPQPCPAS
jgi:hypothetical protein